MYLDHKLIQWLSLKVPEALLLINIIKRLSKKKINPFQPPVISSDYVTWLFQPYEIESYTKTLMKRDFKLQRYTAKLDQRKIATGFVANYIQYCDAIICTNVIRHLKSQNIPVLTVHDCLNVQSICGAIKHRYS